VERLLPFDAELGRGELLLTRGRIAEAQQDFAQAETYYQQAADQLRTLIDAQAGVLHVKATLALCRIARHYGRIAEAESHLLRAEEGVTAHEAMHHRMSEHECGVRLIWCFEAGSTYAARWRSQSDEGAYLQSVASLEQVIELASGPIPAGDPELADAARDMLRDLRKDHDR
jgi:tetratricopeptide (TPR) repeat protein